MRTAIIALTLLAAALAAPADPLDTPSPEQAGPVPPAPPRLETTEKQDGVSKLDEPVEGTDDLKPDATFWGGFGWGYRPYYRSYSYWRPRYYYSAPYWGGWGGGYGYGYGGGWGKYWG